MQWFLKEDGTRIAKGDSGTKYKIPPSGLVIMQESNKTSTDEFKGLKAANMDDVPLLRDAAEDLERGKQAEIAKAKKTKK